jgi:hypothetical protein
MCLRTAPWRRMGKYRAGSLQSELQKQMETSEWYASHLSQKMVPGTHKTDFMGPSVDLIRKTKRKIDDPVENRILVVQSVARHPAYPTERKALNYGSYVGAGCFQGRWLLPWLSEGTGFITPSGLQVHTYNLTLSVPLYNRACMAA